jgi:hypothetical protein
MRRIKRKIAQAEESKKEYNADEYRHRLLAELSGRISEPNAISMPALFEVVYGRPWHDKVNGTRDIRKLITDLRAEGVPICSSTAKDGGGYYLAAAGSELTNYLRRTERRALLILQRNAKIKKISLPNYLGQLRLEMAGGKNREAKQENLF